MKDRGLIYLCKMYAKIGMGAAGGGGEGDEGGGRLHTCTECCWTQLCMGTLPA